jgi:hypothetical protein
MANCQPKATCGHGPRKQLPFTGEDHFPFLGTIAQAKTVVESAHGVSG